MLAALGASLATMCAYRDPATVARGHDALVGPTLGAQPKVPGGWFEAQSFLRHHGRSVATGNRMSVDGKFICAETRDALHGGDSLLVAMAGFFAP